jgi:hypothetical protein
MTQEKKEREKERERERERERTAGEKIWLINDIQTLSCVSRSLSQNICCETEGRGGAHEHAIVNVIKVPKQLGIKGSYIPIIMDYENSISNVILSREKLNEKKLKAFSLK